MANTGAFMSSWAAGAVLALAAAIAALSYFLFRASNSRKSARDAMSRGRRLGIVERTPLDDGRDLILIRRDDVEHLLIVGGPIDMVVESGIRALAPAAAPTDRIYGPERDTRLGSGTRERLTQDRSVSGSNAAEDKVRQVALSIDTRPAISDDDTPLELSLFDRARPGSTTR